MGKYNFDEVIDRHGTDCLKYDFEMKRKGRDDLLPLWVADMDFRLPDEILDEFHKRIDHGIFGYTDPLDEYFDAMNHWFSTRYGYTIEPEWVTLGAGIVYALGTSVRAFTEEGDAMMVMQPVYYPFSEVIKNDGRKLVNCQLRYENNRYSIDFEKMEQMIKEENVKATFFVTDGNSNYRYLLAKEAAAGHTVAIHSATHDYKYIYSSCDAYFEDLNRMSDIITEQTGKRPKLLRFPGGSSNTISKQYCSRIMSVLTKAVSDQGYKYFDWNVSSGDAGGTTSTSEVYNNVISGIQSHDISVVLQHDIKLFSVNAVEDIIVWGLANGYTFLPLTESSPAIHHGVNN